MKMLAKSLIALFLFVGTIDAQPYSQNDQEQDLGEQSLNDFLVVAGSGLGGAVLGLSTLSFVEEPDEHLNNILVGGALGIIAGVIVVVYLKANETSQQMNQGGSYPGYYAQLRTQKLPIEEQNSWFTRPAVQIPVAHWSF